MQRIDAISVGEQRLRALRGDLDRAMAEATERFCQFVPRDGSGGEAELLLADAEVAAQGGW